jgi:hypothetical protein
MQNPLRLLPVPPALLLSGVLVGLFLLLTPPAVQAQAPETDDNPSAVVVTPVGVPPLLVGSFYRYEVQVGGVLAEGWRGPLAVLPSLGVPARNFQLADTIRDNAGIPELPTNLDPPDPKQRLELERQYGEIRAYFDALIKGYNYKAPQFAAAVEKPVTRHQLLQRPRTNRGVVVHVEGNLRRLRRYDAPLMAQLNGVHDVYEGWVFEQESAEPWCIVFPQLPVVVQGEPPLEPGERLNRPVAFDGYFFKAYGYANADKENKVTPLLIGNSPVLKGPPAEAGAPPAMASWSGVLLYGIFGIVLAVGLLAFVLTWWFRRGDARVRDKLTQIAHKQFVDPSELGDDVPEADGLGLPRGNRLSFPPEG